MQKLSNKLTCNVSIEILTYRLINCPNHILHTWNLLGFSAISEKVEQEVRATIAKAPLQCIRGCYLFIIPPDFYNTMSCWAIFVAHQRSAQVLQYAELHKPKACTGHDIIQMSIIFFTAGTKYQNLDIGQYVKLHA